MKVILTQRQYSNEHGSFLDCLEEDYVSYFLDQGFEPLPIPNNPELAATFIDIADGVVLTGGGDIDPRPLGIPSLSDLHISEARDKVEKELIRLAILKDLPVLGVCRGMQFLNVHFGGTVDYNINSDAARHPPGESHDIAVTNEELVRLCGQGKGPVNSYHDHAITESALSRELRTFALSEEGYVEGLFHPNHKIIGVLWHPERNDKLSNWIDTIVMNWFRGTVNIGR